MDKIFIMYGKPCILTLVCTTVFLTPASANPETLLDQAERNHIVERSVVTCQQDEVSPVYSVNNTLYCKCCSPGFYKKGDCSVSGELAECMPCDPGYYSSTFNQALRCSLCQTPAWCERPNTEEVTKCNRTSNAQCRCKDGFYFRKRDGSVSDGDCVKHSVCPGGKYVSEFGTQQSDTVCLPCPKSTFSTSDNLNTSCQNCSVCDPSVNAGVIQECSPTEDTVCSSNQEKQESNKPKTYIIIAVAVPLALVAALLIPIVCYCRRRNRGLKECIRRCPLTKFFTSSERNSLDAENGQPLKLPLKPTEIAAAKTDEPATCAKESQNDILQLSSSPGAFDSIQKKFDFKDGASGREEAINQQNPAQEREKEQPAHTTTSYNREQQLAWDKCLSWISLHISVREWKNIVRSLLVETKCSTRPSQAIIDEITANHPDNSTEQFYKALRKWYELMGPKADLKYIVDALQFVKQNDKAAELRDQFPTLLRERQTYTQIQIPEVGEMDLSEGCALYPDRES